jgi:hypothetical protein
MTAYDFKLTTIDEYLLMSGWTQVGAYWKPPAQIALALIRQAPNHKEAVWRRDQAIQIQVQRDEAAANAACAVEENRKPFGDVTVDDETRYHGARVRVSPRRSSEREYEGAVVRVLNGGTVVEVRPDDMDSIFRVDGAQVERI